MLKVIATKGLSSERKRQYNWWGAVVLQNIPEYSIAVSIPVKILKNIKENTK
jgi:hypothetical protein